MPNFLIHGTRLELGDDIDTSAPLQIQSVPRPYTVTFHSGAGSGARLASEILKHPAPLLLVDQWVFERYLRHEPGLDRVARFVVHATEDKKSIETVLEIVDFLNQQSASKTSMLFAVGGGIIQDLAAFSAYMYKRGIPWTLVPTTLLAQGDSSVGGKTALNHGQTKNLLALFSAPRRIITDTGFLLSLTESDWLSGGGEILRLCITGGERSLQELERSIDGFLNRDMEATTRLIRGALAVKKAVVEFDEFELDTRRSMNYGHSFGHALEALTDFKIAHGIGVTLGILVENEISYLRGVLTPEQRDRIMVLANRIISEPAWAIFRQVRLDGILNLLKRDKKAEGPVLKLATLAQVGRIDFIDLPLAADGESEVSAAYNGVVLALSALRHA